MFINHIQVIAAELCANITHFAVFSAEISLLAHKLFFKGLAKLVFFVALKLAAYNFSILYSAFRKQKNINSNVYACNYLK